MGLSISELKAEKRELEHKIKENQVKLEAVERAILAYSSNPPRIIGEGRKSALGVNFDEEAKRIFRERGNKPLTLSEIVLKIQENHPTLTDMQIKSKVAYAKNNQHILESTGYGEYRYVGLSDEQKTETAQEDQEKQA